MGRLIAVAHMIEKNTGCHSEEPRRRRISPRLLGIIRGACLEWQGEILRFAQDDRKRFLAVFQAALLLVILSSLAGCPSFSPQPDRSRFFALTAKAEADSAADSSGLEQLSLGVGPVRVPGYLDREELVTRVAQNRFEVAQNDRWIEPVEENLSRVLAQNLYTLLRIERVVRHPWPNGRRITHQVEVEIIRFEPTSEREAQLTARWTVVDVATKQPLATRTSFLKRPIQQESREAAVDAMSGTLADLSREIADAVRTVAQQKPAAQK